MIWLIGISSVLFTTLLYLLRKFVIPKGKKPKLSQFSSKVRNIHIELHNYSFFHSPEGSKKTYNRYVGRVRLREKLKTILTNSETRSGAYLVTGFRGMGKTSLVRKAIAEIKGNHYYAISRHFRLFLATVVLYLFESRLPNNLGENWVLTTMASLSIGSIWYLTWHDNNRPNIWKYYNKKYIFHVYAWLLHSIYSILRMLDPEVDYYRRSKFKALLQDIVMVSLMYSIFYFIKGKHEAIVNRALTLELLGALLYINLIYFFIIYVLNNYQLERQEDPKKKIYRNIWGAFLRIFSNAIKRLDYGNKVAIEISLSQDDLKEIDILKLLAKNIYNEYKNLRNRIFAPNRIVYPLCSFFVVYLLIGVLFYYHPIYAQINDFRHRSGIINYFPSQAFFPYVNGEFNPDSVKNFEIGDITILIDSANRKLIDYYTNIDSTSNTKKSDKILIKEPYYRDFHKILENGATLNDATIRDLQNNAFLNGQDSLKWLEQLRNHSFQLRNGRLLVDTLLKPVPQVSYVYDGTLRHLTATMDYVIQAYYQRFFHSIIGLIGREPDNIRGEPGQENSQKRGSLDFRFLPALLDYFFILSIFLFLGIITLVSRSAWRLGLVNHSYVLKRLRLLNENISAQIVHEKGQGMDLKTGGFSQVFNFFSRKSRTYPIAGVREIENELIDILNDIDRIPSISSRPEFIFIFDELDKIEAQFNPNIQDREKEELASFSSEEEGYFSTESIRRRQETIARILGNLKLFFNTARAKFIFIAGREMYDASLADISDRESFISSIFHEILYVESFFRDSSSTGGTDITSTTRICLSIIDAKIYKTP